MKRHPTDLVSLVTGLTFVAVAVAAWADLLTLRSVDAAWAWPVLLIGAGLVLLAGLRRGDADAPVGADGHDDVGTAGPADEWERDPVDG